MEGTDENYIDDLDTYDILRRAKEREHNRPWKSEAFVRGEKEGSIERMIEKIDKKGGSKSPEKIASNSSLTSPTRSRSILKPILSNEEGKPETRPTKKCVTTFDAMTGDTIVESKTFLSDNDEDDEEGSDEEEFEEDECAIPRPMDEEKSQSLNDDGTDNGETQKSKHTPLRSNVLKKLADFHSTDMEVESPVHPHTPLETLNYVNDNNKDGEDQVRVSASRGARTSRLSALAKTINEWEDDLTHHSIPGSRFVEATNNGSRASLSGRSKFASASSPSASSPLSFGGKQAISGELQGFSRRQGSPLKQIREHDRSPMRKDDSSGDEEVPLNTSQQSPSKTYFGGSPFKGVRSPKKTFAPQPPIQSPVKAHSPIKGTFNLSGSPNKSVSPVKRSPAANSSTEQSTLIDNSPVETRRSVSPTKSVGMIVNELNESTCVGKPVSAIRMKFEGGVKQSQTGPVKPERSRLKPYAAPPPPKASNAFKSSTSSSSSSPVKKFQFGQPEKDPSCLTVAERAKLFEKSNFCPLPKTPIAADHFQAKKPTVYTSSPYMDEFKPSGNVTPAQSVKRPAPPPPTLTPGCPPPPPPPPTTSTPTNLSSKRRSTSPARGFQAESLSVKRIKVNAPKPGQIYPSLTDIETETETEAEGHCSEVESMDDSMESQQSLGAQIETIAKACSPIRPTPGGKMPPRYRPSEDFSATFACAQVDALIDEALEGQDVTGTTINFSLNETEKTKSCSGSGDSANSVIEVAASSLESTVVRCIAHAADLSSDSASSFPVDDDPRLNMDDDALENVSYSEAETTASSSFTSSPVPSISHSNSNNSSSASALSSIIANVDNNPASAQETIEFDSKNLPDVYQDKPEEEPTQPRQLVHTVSFYRRQQQQQNKKTGTNLNDISEHPESCEESEDDSGEEEERERVQDVIRKLEEEIEGRNLAIAQASKALNWCKTLVGFSDSTEYIECERILLIETQRRLALLNSIHRLKTEGALGQKMPSLFSPSKQEVSPSCKGNMKLADIAVTLRRDYFSAHRAESQYHFVCLIKNKHHIEHTGLLTYDSQRQGSTLRFPNEFNLQNLEPGFHVQMELYYLECAKEFLPHEAKYRINAKKDSKHATLLSPLLTPSKKGGKGEHSKPYIHSPAGPDAVKSTSFKYCGGLSIDISSLQRTYWELDKASGPLAGGVSLRIQCSAMGGVEHKGFLTLFDDVSGYGAWVRRWCRLGPAVLEFWKYPEDETEGKKPPLGSLNLHECVTSKVRPAPRDVCARANTLLLVTTRAPHPNDRDTLVTSCHKGYTAVRHLISADLREERDIWCHKLNKALANLRAWDPVAKQSVDDNLF